VRTLTLPRGHAYAVAYAPGGRLLASGDSYGAVYFWDLASFTPRCVFRPEQEAKVWSVAFTAAGDRLILEDRLFDARPLAAALRRAPGAGGPDTLDLPEVRLQGEGGAAPPDLVGELLGTPDGRSVVAPHWPWLYRAEGNLMQWDLDGRCRRTVPIVSWVKLLAFTADGTALAVARAHTAVGLWDWAAGAEVALLKHTDDVHDAAFTPDGRLLGTAAGRIVRLWDVAARACVARFPAFRGRAFGLALHPRGRLLAAGSMDGTVRLWDVVAAREVERYDWQVGAIRSVAFSPDGMTAAAAGHKKAIVIWDVGDLAG
jgi:WD40 repeat protein